MKTISCWAAMAVILTGAGWGQEERNAAKTLSGILKVDRALEGGTWTMKEGATVFDLHGNFSGFSGGESVEIEGHAFPDRACYHQVGTVFKVARITKIRANLRLARTGSPAQQGLRGADYSQRGSDPPRHDPAHGAQSRQFLNTL